MWANLATVREQLDTLKSGKPDKNLLTKEKIEEARKYIENERKDPKHNTSLETDFKAWEDLIARYDMDKGQLKAITTTATAEVAATAEAKNKLDTLAKQTELENSVMSALKEQLQWLDGKLEKMDMSELDQSIALMKAIQSLSWMEKFPGLKEQAQEVRKYEPMIQGLSWATLVKKLESLGYSLRFTSPNQVKVISPKPDAIELEAKLNAYLGQSPVLAPVLQSGILYTSESFHRYRTTVTDSEKWEFIDPKTVTLKWYTDFLRRKSPNALSLSEKSFLQSKDFFTHTWFDFQKSLLQSKDYPKFVSLVQQVTGDTDVAKLVPDWVQAPPSPAQDPVGATSNTDTTKESSDATAAGAVGAGIGKVGGFIGKLAGAGAGGGIRVLGEVFTEATKHGGAWGALAVIGGLLWSVFSKNGLGFWGTLGAIFGVGVLDSASRWDLKGLGGKDNEKKWEASDATAGAAGWAAASAESGQEQAPETSPTPLTRDILLARALGRPDIHNADVEKEKPIITSIGKMNFEKLRVALEKNDQTSWDAAFNSAWVKEGTKEYTGLAAVIHRDNTFARTTMTAYVAHLAANTHVNALTPDERQKRNLDEMADYVVNKENENATASPVPVTDPEWKPAKVPPNTPSPESILNEYGAYGDLIVVARMVEYGYLPKINYTAGEVLNKEGKMPRLLKWAIYIGLWGPLTNNKPGENWFSGKHRQYEQTFYKWLDEKIKIERQEIATRTNNPSFQGLYDETIARSKSLDSLKAAIDSWNAEGIKKALSEYRKAAKTPFWKDRMENPDKLHSEQRENILKVNRINAEIEANYKAMIEAQQTANVDWATQEAKNAAHAAIEKYNKNLLDLQAAGIRSLAELPPAIRAQVSQTNPWVARVTAANGWLEKFNGKLNEFTSKGIAKWIMGVGLVWLIWNHKGSAMELWNKGDYESLAKIGWDFTAGAIPIVSSVHESLILSNTGWYRDFILGKDYKMSDLEKWFRVVWAVPLGGLVTKTVWKWVLAVGEAASVGAIKTTGRVIEGVSDIALGSVKNVGQIATFGVLAYTAYQFTADISNHLTWKEVRKESALA